MRTLITLAALLAGLAHAEPPDATSARPIVVDLGPPKLDHDQSGMILIRPTAGDCPEVFEDPDRAIARPDVLCEQLRAGKTRFAYALDPARLELAVDVDRDGQLDASEWRSLAPQDGEHVREVTLPRPMEDGSTLPVRLGLRWDPEQEWVGVVGITRAGQVQLPGGPMQVTTSERSGVWSEWSSVGLDLDRDGSVAGVNLLEVGRNERVVRLDDVFWQVHVDARADTLTLTPVEPPEGVLAKHAPAPEFELPDLDGEPHSVARYRGRWLLMDFWGTWCGPCKADMPRLVAWEAEQEEDVAVLGMASDKPAPLRAYLKRNTHPWPDIPIRQSRGVSKAYDVRGWPTYVLVDPDGDLVAIGTLDHVTGSLETARQGRRGDR